MLPCMQWGKIQNVQQTSVILLSGAVWIECPDSDRIRSGKIWCLNKPKHACCGVGTVEMGMICRPEGSYAHCRQRRDAWQSALAPVCPIVLGRFSDFSSGTQRNRTSVVCFSAEVNLLNPLSQLCTPCSHIPTQSSAHTKAPICSASDISGH